MSEELYLYEKYRKGTKEYLIKRKAKKIKCFSCDEEWVIRADKKAPMFCRACKVKGDKNPMYQKKPWNFGILTYDKKTYARNYYNNLRHERKKELIKYMGNQCALCKQQNLPICVWQWHHVDPKQKIKALSQLLIKNREELYEESKKCILLCSNCHKIHHYGDERLE